jgi:hypothetical protein
MTWIVWLEPIGAACVSTMAVGQLRYEPVVSRNTQRTGEEHEEKDDARQHDRGGVEGGRPATRSTAPELVFCSSRVGSAMVHAKHSCRHSLSGSKHQSTANSGPPSKDHLAFIPQSVHVMAPAFTGVSETLGAVLK